MKGELDLTGMRIRMNGINGDHMEWNLTVKIEECDEWVEGILRCHVARASMGVYMWYKNPYYK